MQSIEECIRTVMHDWRGPVGETRIFGTRDPARIGRAVERFCRRELGSAVAGALFFESSSASVFGLVLDDGRRVALKAHRRSIGQGFLADVQRVQRRLVRRGFPCPRPILEPRPISRGIAVVEEVLDDGEFADGHDPAIRRQVARALARLVELTRGIRPTTSLAPAWLPSSPRLWPKPHHPVFDFVATRRGAEWIDLIAARAKQQLRRPAGRTVIGHTDWSVKDMRFRGKRLTAVYDWQSLARDREPVIVGQASAAFTATWRFPTRVAPAAEERAAFVREYERARGREFSEREATVLGAAATYLTAYVARCEHAVATAPGPPPGSFREALRAMVG